MTWLDGFKEDLLKYVRKYEPSAIEITNWDDVAYAGYGCDTCGPDMDYEVDISYTVEDGRRRCYTYNGSFTQLIRELTQL